MVKFIKCIIKYPALITLTVLFVNVFCFKVHLYDGNWLNWIWFVFNCIVCILSVFFVSGDIFGDDETEILFKLLNGLGSFIIYGGIILKVELTEVPETNLIWLATIAFFLQNGIGQYSSLLSSIIAIIYIYTNYLFLDNYYSIILFVIGLLSVIAAVISLWMVKLEDDDSYDITPISVLGLLSIITCFLIKSNFPEMIGNRLYLFGGYLICSFYSFISNKAILYTILPIITVSYCIYFVYSFDAFSIILLTCLLLFSISSYAYVSNLRFIINSQQSLLFAITEKNKKLADQNQKLERLVKELRESNNDNTNNKGSSWIDSATNGINIARSIDWLINKLGQLGDTISGI